MNEALMKGYNAGQDYLINGQSSKPTNPFPPQTEEHSHWNEGFEIGSNDPDKTYPIE